ncbi:hypothetical protein OIDMADRAFT_58897 [Oidiodendron maius Zn]|uniref:Uncharacterized protein n=1 Tax=Oidiodendron maius (strain Zn) TaxID=913774 RepID=A0A0C3H257_OIDMZ|nr:hypothetical protein OIDMADRAFT_58897 [Oidiodendron maius Zn]
MERVSEDNPETQTFLLGETIGKRRLSSAPWPWILTGLLAVSTMTLSVLLFSSAADCKARCTMQNQRSDFPAARSAIEYHEVMFTGNPIHKEDGTIYVPHPGAIRYVGTPSPEVDKAWANLTKTRDPMITEAEAKELWPDNYHDYWHHQKGGYVVGFDMFHTLHCLNQLRKAFHPEYYPVVPSAIGDAHRDHCIDHIRQQIMCSGDMTAYGTRYQPSVNHNYADSDVVHICRNFDKLRAWTTDRHNKGVKPKVSS